MIALTARRPGAEHMTRSYIGSRWAKNAEGRYLDRRPHHEISVPRLDEHRAGADSQTRRSRQFQIPIAPIASAVVASLRYMEDLVLHPSLSNRFDLLAGHDKGLTMYGSWTTSFTRAAA